MRYLFIFWRGNFKPQSVYTFISHVNETYLWILDFGEGRFWISEHVSIVWAPLNCKTDVSRHVMA